MEMNGYRDITKHDYDEARKLWLINDVIGDPHAGDQIVYKIRALNVTFAYDLGYRQALLSLRKEFDVRLKRFDGERHDTRDTRYGERHYSLGKFELNVHHELTLPYESYVCVKRSKDNEHQSVSVTNIADKAFVEPNVIYSCINIIRQRIDEKIQQSYQSHGYQRDHVLVIEMDRYMKVICGDYEEYRNLLLIHSMDVDPSAGDENIYSLSTLDATFIYDLGYRQALLSLRKEFDDGLKRLESEVGQNTFRTHIDALNNAELNAIDSFVDIIRQRIDEKIEHSYLTEGLEKRSHIRWQRRRYCENRGDW
jgi:hypothetical protein